MTARIASLGMYDNAALRPPNDALWAALATRLRTAGIEDVPDHLERDRSLPDIWSAPDLLLAQTCGYPLMTEWHGRLRYVATPRYRAPGCEGSFHRSRLVVRRNDPAQTLKAFQGRRAALNDGASNTGMNLFRAAIAPHAEGPRFFETVVETGSHAASARAVAVGDADIAAIDAVSFAHLDRLEPETTGRLRTLGWTAATPGLPLVTTANATQRDITILRRALRSVAHEPTMESPRETLLLEGFDILHPAQYQAVLRLESQATRNHYPALR